MGDKKAVKVAATVAAATVLVSGCKPVSSTPEKENPAVCVTSDDPGRGSCR